jgi:hypothetical protein
MPVNEKTYYSYRFPKSSEYHVKYFSPIVMVAIILLMTLFLDRYKELSSIYLINMLLFCPSTYLFVMLWDMMLKINMLIRRIEKVCTENLNLAKNGQDYRNHLFVCDVNYAQHRGIQFSAVAIIILILFYVLTKPLKIETLYRFYITWILTFIIINTFLFASLKNIARFFCALKNVCHEVILKDKDFAASFLNNEPLIDRKKYDNKWRNLMILNAFSLLIIVIASFIFIDFRGAARSTSFLISLIIISMILVDVNVIIKSTLGITGEYDEYSKANLDMEFIKPPEVDISPSLSGNIEYLFESNKNLPREMISAVKDTAKEVAAIFKRKKK